MTLSVEDTHSSVCRGSSAISLLCGGLLSFALHLTALWFLAGRSVSPLPPDALSAVVLTLSAEAEFAPSLEKIQVGVEQVLTLPAGESQAEQHIDNNDFLSEKPSPDSVLPALQLKPKVVKKTGEKTNVPKHKIVKNKGNSEVLSTVMSKSSPLSGAAQRVSAPNNSYSLQHVQVRASWAGVLQSHLANFKRYPPGARKQKRQGTAIVKFIVDSRGRVLSATLTSSSGTLLLDREALAILKRAQPLPFPPTELLSRGQVVISLPVDFEIKPRAESAR